MGSLGWDLWFEICGLGSAVWDLWFGYFGLGALIGDLWFGIFQISDFEFQIASEAGGTS